MDIPLATRVARRSKKRDKRAFIDFIVSALVVLENTRNGILVTMVNVSETTWKSKEKMPRAPVLLRHS
jgi:hypothetical protein